MKFKDRKDPIELPPIDEETLKKVHFSTEMDPAEYYDIMQPVHVHGFYIGTNVLAEVDRDDSARRAMRKDAK